MNNNKPKENWGKPKLIVIVRGRPEEMILAGCKVSGVSGTPGGVYLACRKFRITGGFGAHDCLGYCDDTVSS